MLRWFSLGLIALAAILAVVTVPMTAILLGFLGIVLGLLSITAKERQEFIIASLAITLIGVAALTQITPVDSLMTFMKAFGGDLAFAFGPAAVVTAVLSVYSKTESK